MKTTLSALCFALAALLVGAGCGSIDTTPAGNPDRTLQGTVSFAGSLPAGAEVVVRVVEPPSSEPARVAGNDAAIGVAPTVQRTERVLGETKQLVPAATMQPVAFKVEYRADDAVLRRGVTVDVRVSVAGKVRFRTVNAHGVTLRTAGFPQEIAVQAVQ